MTALFSPHVEQLISLALAEDLCGGDASTDALFPPEHLSDAYLIAKAPLVLAGGPIFSYVMQRVAELPGAGSPPSITWLVDDGTRVAAGAHLATMQGPTRLLLRGERLALNLLQRLSGVATQVRHFVDIFGDRPAITGTRKTTPGMRELQRYAVRAGGGRNHRYNLSGGVMLKDNHIAAAGGIAAAVERVRAVAPHTLRIEVETTTLDEVAQALDAGADIIMLDNMDVPTMTLAIAMIDHRALTEISGNVTLERAPELAKLDVDFVSSGALTHSVTAADISMRFGA